VASMLLVHLIVSWLLPGAAVGGPQQPRYSATTRSPHGALTTPCQNCHTFTGWKPIRNVPEFDHNKTRYPLRGLHEGVACRQCHTNLVFTNVGTQCADCHADIHRRQFGASCEQCHTVKGWRVSVQAIQQHQNRFPLFGAHALLQCDDCHKGAATGQFQGLSTDCVSCHTRQFQQAVPNHVALKFPSDCRQCHTMDTWVGATFDHLRMTGFGLTGMHARLECTACHVGGRYQGTPVDCVGCHAKDFAGAQNPDHVKAGFPTSCATCHNTSSWMQATFDHNTFTKFPLTGAHKNVACTQCHVNNRFAGTPTDCASCHLPDFNKTTNPNHAAVGFPTTCQTCHTTVSWANAKFDHSATGFPLTGAHSKAQCSSCHTGGQFTKLSTDCVSCHLKNFQGTTNPNHVAAGIPQTCQVCHNTAAWTPASFDHSKSGFPLTGAHATTPCASCHINNNYNLTNTTCVSCHLKNFQTTTNPNHVASGFPQTCESCHNTAAWIPASFDHSKTGFPLTGAHVTTPCASCHINNNYNLTNTTCVSCHLKNFQSTTNPNHVASGFPQTCESCHNTAAWIPASFDHSKTGFPLTGAHATTPCASCHINNNYNLTNTACSSCHLKDFQATTNPNHAAAGFPTDCSICHTTTSWAGATFDHSKTGFPLTGAHINTPCQSCHVNNNFNLTSTLCVSCHLKDFQGTTNPNHVSAGFPQQCEVCHNTAAWIPASFDHNKTAFPLTGAHTKVACNSCHINGQFAGTPTDCYSCHKPDYLGTTNPNHPAAGFPTTCALCHNTTSWAGATFNHTWFPIYSGTHAGKWTTCGDCHTNPSNYAVFSCITCHQHDRANTDPNHTDVRNYVYSPTSCYSCHPTGQGGG